MVLHDWDRAEDVAQQAFLEAFVGLAGLQDTGRFRNGLLTAICHGVNDQQQIAAQYGLLTDQVRGPPISHGGGKWGATKAHGASVQSLG